jgi:hypothetical protein
LEDAKYLFRPAEPRLTMPIDTPHYRQLVPALDPPTDLQLSLHGWIGDRVRANEANWLIPAPATNPGMLEMFVHRNDAHIQGLTEGAVPWAGEFAGKYLLSGVQSLRLTGSVALADVLRDFVLKLISTQGSDGSLGMPLHWDLWGQYHVMLGLLRWHEHSGDDSALVACRRAADLACARYLGQAWRIAADNPVPVDDEKNQAIVHVLALLYERTGETSYLNLVREIEAEWSKLYCGTFIVHALAGKEFYEGTRPRWETLHDVQAIAELYFITGEPRYSTAFQQIWRSIRAHDRHSTGGFTSGEVVTGNPFDPCYIETCGTVAWMALTIDMLRMTADSTAADELELSLFNAILGAQSPDGRLWTYHTPMGGIPIDGVSPENPPVLAARLGYRLPAYYDLQWQALDRYPQLSCCAANGPRGLGCLSEWAVMLAHDAIVINYYGPAQLALTAPGGIRVSLKLETAYPFDGVVRITVTPTSATTFAIHLRIPAWSRSSSVAINGTQQAGVQAGSYFVMQRVWQPNDGVTLTLDMGIRIVTGQRNAAGLSAAYRGPLLLAYDSRLGHFDPISLPAPRLTRAPIIATNTPSAALLATFPSSAGDITLCDFASAGQSNAGALFGRPDPTGVWQFSRSDRTLIAEQIRLMDDGSIRRLMDDGSINGYPHRNEARWGYDGDVLTFYTVDSVPSTRFTQRATQRGKQVLSGTSLLDSRVRHILAQVDHAVVGKTWQFLRQDPSGAKTILRSTIRLLAGGGFEGPTHPNEARWGIEGDKLVFYAANGAASTRFTSIRMWNGRVERSGVFLFDTSITHVLDEVDSDLSSRVWRFMRKVSGKVEKPPLADKVRLLPNQHLDGYWHPNEISWSYDAANDSLKFFDARGAVSTDFGSLRATDGVMRFEGPSAFDAAITHILEESCPGWTLDSTYVSWLPSITPHAAPALAVARAPDHMDLFWVHPDGAINSTWWDEKVAGENWILERVFAATGPGLAIASPVTAVARTPDHLDVFWIHPDGSIRSTWWDANAAGEAWPPDRVFAATPAGMAAPGAIAAVARTPDHLDVFWIHPDGSIRSTWWDANTAGGAWLPSRVFTATPAGEAVPGLVAVLSRTPKHLDVFWIHPDRSIRSTWWDVDIAGGDWDPVRVSPACVSNSVM